MLIISISTINNIEFQSVTTIRQCGKSRRIDTLGHVPGGIYIALDYHNKRGTEDIKKIYEGLKTKLRTCWL